MAPLDEIVIDLQGIKTQFGDNVVHENLELQIKRGEIIAIVGGSGSGKTTLLREILMLHKPSAGTVRVFDQDVFNIGPKEQLDIRHRWGVMFQHGALFSSLNVLENICFPLQEFTSLNHAMINEIAMLKAQMAQFPLSALTKDPAELSGGMLKRAAIARAIVLDPELLFLDEPTAGLDPHSAAALDELVLNLKHTLGLTVVMVTHDLDTLWKVADRVAFLGENRVLAIDTMTNLSQATHPLLREYFQSARARVAQPGNAIGESSQGVTDGNPG